MTTIVNTTTPGQDSNSEGSGSGLVIGSLVFVAFLAIALYFGYPAIKQMQPMEVNVPAPQITIDSPQVVVPDKVEVVKEE
jgi:hypothetical protein